MSRDGLIFICAALLVTTAAVHSVLGERRLLQPLLAERNGVLKHHLARFLIRAVWHLMTITFLIIAGALVAARVSTFTTEAALLVLTAIGIGGAGIYDAIGSRGKHIGWPLLVAIGGSAFLALGMKT